MWNKFDFEQIYSNNVTQVTRSQVPGGWLVNILVNAPRGQACMTTTFINDPEWLWQWKTDDEVQSQEPSTP